jgi:uncharacterized surface protein with fasciclin (FAS1) repeats
MSDSTIDYNVLVNPAFTQFDLARAHAYGLSNKVIAKIWAIADMSGARPYDILGKVESGRAIPSLADEYGIRQTSLDNLREYENKVTNLEAAYANTGEGRAKSIVKGWSGEISSADYTATPMNTTPASSTSMSSIPTNAMPMSTTTTSVTTSSTSTSPSGDIIATAQSAGNFTTFLRAVRMAGLESSLRGAGPYTVFAPTDAAFAKIPSDQLSALLGDTPRLTRVLQMHVIPARITASDAMAMTSPTSPATLAGSTLNVTSSNGVVWVNGASVVTPDIQASNGVIHAIDTVLMPASN